MCSGKMMIGMMMKGTEYSGVGWSEVEAKTQIAGRRKKRMINRKINSPLSHTLFKQTGNRGI